MFQQKVNLYPALGVPGTLSRLNPVTKLPKFAGKGVMAGGFCYSDGKGGNMTVYGASEDNSATAVEGFVVMERFQANLSGKDSLAVNEGEEVAVIKKGFCYAQLSNYANPNDKVFVNKKTGEMKTGESAGDDEIDTGWIVVTGGDSSMVCEIACI